MSNNENIWTAQVLTLFPEMFPGPLGVSLAGKALQEGIWRIETLDIRQYAGNKHRAVDDTPAGGGSGMVMRADVLGRAIDAARVAANDEWPLVCLSPRGRLFNQAMARAWKEKGGVTLLCGRFEGVDERIFEARPIEEVSVGDFVLSGGEPAAITVLDAVIRLLPGVVGDPEALKEESFEEGLLEYPHYTRPRTWEDRDIPEILLSGDHKRIAEWRREKAKDLTKSRRPDIWKKRVAQTIKGDDHE